MGNLRCFSGMVKKGLGIKGSSQDILGDIDPSRALGQAQIKTTFNAFNGNLVVQDCRINIDTLGFHFNFGMIYNSAVKHPNNAWRLNITKKITSFPQSLNPLNRKLTVLQEDGSLVTFHHDAEKCCYIAKGLADGHHTLRSFPDGTWESCALGTGVKTYFSTEGLQTSMVDRLGRECTFHYDNNNQLQDIQLPSNEKLLFQYENNVLTVSHQDEENKTHPVVKYTFDERRRLASTSIPVSERKDYSTNYSYYGNSHRLKKIEQSDGTRLKFSFQETNENVYVVDSIAIGDNPSYLIDYQDLATRLVDPLGEVTEFYFDQTKPEALQSIATSLNGSMPQTQSFTYTDEGLLYQKTMGECVETREYDCNGLLETIKDGLLHTKHQFHTCLMHLVGMIQKHDLFKIATENYQGWIDSVLIKENRRSLWKHDREDGLANAKKAFYIGKTDATNITECLIRLWEMYRTRSQNLILRRLHRHSFENFLLATMIQFVLEKYPEDETSQAIKGKLKKDYHYDFESEANPRDFIGKFLDFNGKSKIVFLEMFIDFWPMGSPSIPFPEKEARSTHELQRFASSRDQHYSSEGLLISHVSYTTEGDVNTALVHRYVYNEKFQLCYEVTPSGCVTAYGYDENNNRISNRRYLSTALDMSAYRFDQSILHSEVESWCCQQDITQTQLIEFDYNSRGQCTQEKHYVTLGPDGTGIFDDKTQCITRKWDCFGNLLSESQQQSANVITTNSYDFDGLQRLVVHKNPLQEVTTINYLDAEQTVITTLPNQLMKAVVTDCSGLISARRESHEAVIRQTVYSRDDVGQVYECQHPDQQKTRQIHDARGRLKYEVDPAGYVTEYFYDDRDHIIEIIHYAEPIADMKIIDWKTIKDLGDIVFCTVGKDRYVSRLYDAANRLRYSIDAEDAVTEYQYNDANQQIALIHYYNPLDASIPRILVDGMSLPVTQHAKDRIHHFYRDKDGYIIGEHDAAGYLTEIKRDCSGNIMETIRYATPTAIANSLEAARPEVDNEKDSHHRYFRDLQGQVVAELNAESYLTSYQRLSGGLVQKTTQHAKRVDAMDLQLMDANTPTVDPENRVILHQYDGLNRETEKFHVTQGLSVKTTFDSVGNVTSVSQQDTLDTTTIRETHIRHNAWSQTIATLDPRSFPSYQAIQQDHTLSEKQKKVLLEKLWAEAASKNNYDD